MSDGVIINRAGVDRLLDGLQSSVTGDAMMRALTEGAKLLRERSRATLIARVKGATSDAVKMRRHKMQSYGAPVDGILYNVHPNGVMVNIMADFRLKWFERGTQIRYTKGRRGKAVAYRGLITPTRFFTDAARSSLADMERAIMDSLDKYFRSLNK